MPDVTILLPNYKTPELTELCLRALRRYTAPERYRLIAIDNASGDASLDYLRRQPDLTLIERDADELAGMGPAQMHASALDLAFRDVDTPLVLSIHTDTFVTRANWLDFLCAELAQSEKLAGVGSWKLEYESWLKRFGKKLEAWFKPPRLAEHERMFLRSHCALFKTDLVRQYTHGFGAGETAGKAMCRELVAAGYEIKLISSELLTPYMRHLNHATMILNPELGGRRTAAPRARRKLRRELEKLVGE